MRLYHTILLYCDLICDLVYWISYRIICKNIHDCMAVWGLLQQVRWQELGHSTSVGKHLATSDLDKDWQFSLGRVGIPAWSGGQGQGWHQQGVSLKL